MAKTDSIEKNSLDCDTTCLHVIKDALGHSVFDVFCLTNSIYITLLNLFAETRTMFTFIEYKNVYEDNLCEWI